MKKRDEMYNGYRVPLYRSLRGLEEACRPEPGECTAPGYMCANGSCDLCLVSDENLKQQYIKTKTSNVNTESKEGAMNKNISEVFEKTKDALLVEKHLGNEIGTTFIDGLLLQDKKKEILAEVKKRELAEELRK